LSFTETRRGAERPRSPKGKRAGLSLSLKKELSRVRGITVATGKGERRDAKGCNSSWEERKDRKEKIKKIVHRS